MSAVDPRLSRWLVWLAPFALLALAIGWQTDWGRELRRPPPPETPVTPAPVATTVLPEFRIEGGVASMAATVERPLFNATRRPAPPAVADAAKSSIQRGQFTLTGTLVTDKTAIAFLRETGGAGKARSVRKGESINGMTVAEVTSDRVRFTMGDDAEELELKVAKGPKTTVQPAAEGAQQAPQQAAGAPQPPPPGQGDVGGVRRAAQGGLSGPGAAGDNLRANRRAARAAEAQGGAQQGAAQAQQLTRQQRRAQQQAQ
jgi:hypothetical protein